ncbi:MAG: hypothetical protein AAFY85_05925, partial [Pseudomonadota bacterium]
MRTFRGYFSQRKQAAVNVIRAESMGLETAASVMAEAPRVMLIAAALIAAVWAGGHAVGAYMSGL